MDVDDAAELRRSGPHLVPPPAATFGGALRAIASVANLAKQFHHPTAF